MRSYTLRRTGSIVFLAGAVVILPAIFLRAQTPASGPILRLSATSENVSGAPDSIRIDLLRWSTDAERDQMITAWNLTPALAAAAEVAARGGGGGAGGGRGGNRGGGARGADAPAANAPAGNAAAGDAAATDGAAAAAGRGGARGGGGGGARGGGGGRGGRGGAPEPAVPQTPEAALVAALEKAPTLGYLWSSEAAGYAFHYAVRLPQTDGSERIILISDRRLGAWNNLWKPAGSATANNYEFSVIELRLNAKGEGEGKTSLTGKVVVDSAAKTLTLDNYASLPVVLKGVKRRTS
jgi:hypothetical protein